MAIKGQRGGKSQQAERVCEGVKTMRKTAQEDPQITKNFEKILTRLGESHSNDFSLEVSCTGQECLSSGTPTMVSLWKQPNKNVPHLEHCGRSQSSGRWRLSHDSIPCRWFSLQGRLTHSYDSHSQCLPKYLITQYKVSDPLNFLNLCSFCSLIS